MTKIDLRNGDICTLRDGSVYRFLDIGGCKIFIGEEFLYNYCNVKDDLTSKCSKELDIMSVRRFDKFADQPDGLILKYNDKLTKIWQRDEIIEVTMEDIENKFGCKVKIVNK